ncbi:FecR family protein [Hydrogenophaga sp.]|uniref:FecR family protein n=1 Tax=Hydrogenophaga sp. TaxID=1904254 RepID=UPI002FCBD091
MSEVDERIAQKAAQWLVSLSADDADERRSATAAFEAWKRADPRHAAVAQGMEGFIDQARRLRGEGPLSAARATLSSVLDTSAPRRPATSGRRAAGLLALAVALVLPAALLLHGSPTRWGADLSTGTGEQMEHTLQDGSRLTLGTGSAVNTRWSADRRQIDLLSGEILVQVAPDAARPFVVETAHGHIRALGTRFIVRRDEGSTLLTMLESRTAVSAWTGAELTVDAGEQARLSGAGVERVGAVPAGVTEEAFLSRRLWVHDRPLPEVLDEIARHRRGLIRYDRERIADIRVSAVLPLDDTDRALQLLASSFPQLRVRTVTPWVALVDSAP